MTTQLIPDSDQVILGLCLHGQAQVIDRSIYRPEYLESDLSRKLVGACIELARENKDVNAISAIAKSRLSVPGLSGEMIRLARNGFGQADPADAVQHSYQIYVNRKAEAMGQEIINLSHKDPANFKGWLGRIGVSMASLIQGGDSYDPRPSVHADKPLPKVFAPSLITGMNDLMRGGYWSSYLLIYAGVTSHGKSVTLKTHAIDLVLQKKRVVFIVTENGESALSAKIAAAIADVDYDKEVRYKTFKGNEYETAETRQARYTQVKLWLDDYLLVYGPDYYNDEALKRIVRWQHPDAVIIDYFQNLPNMFAKASYSKDEGGDFANFLLKFAEINGLWIGTGGQMAGATAKKFMESKKGDISDVMLYGSARIEYASSLFVPLRRHPLKKDYAWFKVKKDREVGRLNDVHEIQLDISRGILDIQRLRLLGARIMDTLEAF